MRLREVVQQNLCLPRAEAAPDAVHVGKPWAVGAPREQSRLEGVHELRSNQARQRAAPSAVGDTSFDPLGEAVAITHPSTLVS